MMKKRLGISCLALCMLAMFLLPSTLAQNELSTTDKEEFTSKISGDLAEAMEELETKLPHYALRIPMPTMNKLKYIPRIMVAPNKEIEQLILRHIAAFEKKHCVIENDA